MFQIWWIGEGSRGDVVAGWVNEDGHAVISDYWDDGNRQPSSDLARGCTNDVEPIAGSIFDGVTTLRFRLSIIMVTCATKGPGPISKRNGQN